jgi:UPF0271 protein
VKQIDLNCDLGEIAGAVTDGTQEALMASITSVNIACGGHAGDDEIMEATIRQAMRQGVAIGAHPGYEDRAHFGRLEIDMPAHSIVDMVYRQVTDFARIASDCNARVVHVKAHGALYNKAVHDAAVCRAIVEGVAGWDIDVVLVGLAGSPMLQVFRQGGFRVAAEAFADRRYESDGSLRHRSYPNALIRDADAAAEQALQIVVHGAATSVDGIEVPIDAQTICIHGDTPGSTEIAAAVAKRLRSAGVELRGIGGTRTN